jgi:hypothetical protein
VDDGHFGVGDGMRGEQGKEPMYYTSPEWIDKETPELSPWPLASKKQGDRSRLKSGGTAKALGLLRRLEREGLLK